MSLFRRFMGWFGIRSQKDTPEPGQLYHGNLEKALGANFSIRIRRNGTWTCTCGMNGGGGATNLYRHRQRDH
jgi:hypothetical protein